MDFIYTPVDPIIYVQTAGASYSLGSMSFVLTITPSNPDVAISGMATVGKAYFGVESTPIFSFGKTSEFTGGIGTSKKQACSNFGYTVSQKTVLAGVPEATKEFLQKMDTSQWTPISFNTKKRQVCIQIDTDSGMNIIAVELLAF